MVAGIAAHRAHERELEDSREHRDTALRAKRRLRVVKDARPKRFEVWATTKCVWYRSEMKRWKGKVAWVTGASSGIGKAIVERLVGHGMKVAASARRVDRLDALEGAHAFPVDVRDADAIAECSRRIVSELGGIDVLVNNAGLGRHAPLCAGPIDAWREMLEVNVLGLAICTQHAVADMHRRGGEGHVIHIASMASHRVPPNSGMYSATKYAVRSLTESLRQELRESQSKVRVSAISPGFVETEFAGVYWDDADKAKETYSRFRVLDPSDVTDALEYLLAAPPHVQVHDILMRPTEQRS